ncbi:MAG: tetratricopeptide repeat protein [Aristaeellaceae bacterium]
MKKRLITLLAALALALTATGCTASNEDYYQQAQRFLGAGDFAGAAQLFDQLGGYKDSGEYALYAAGLYALQQGEHELARSTLLQVDPFLNSSRYLTYLNAAKLAETDDLEGAMALYASLGAFADSAEQARSLQAAIPARDIRRAKALMVSGGWQQAQAMLEPYKGLEEADALLEQCEEGLQQAAYDKADGLYQAGDFGQAMAAFDALGDTLDAKARALSCRSALYLELEKEYAAATLSTYESLIARYTAMDGYLDSASRIRDLQARFATNMALRDIADTHPYVVYGRYPVDESGASQPLTWQVLGVTEDTATLLCTQVIDAMPLASATDLTLPEDTVPLTLPDLEQVSLLDDLSCTATPYAMAQGAQHHSDGRAWWWLADEAPEGRQAIVWYNGSVMTGGVEPSEATIGLRPLLCVDLNHYAFTQGSGTQENPFR